MGIYNGLLTAITCVLVAVAAGAAETDKTELRPPMWAMFHWASNPAVQDELHLSMAQRKQLEALRNEYRAVTAAPKSRREVPPEEREAWDAERAKRNASVDRDIRPKLDNLLEAEQHKRLGEIYLQSLIWLNGPAGGPRTPAAEAIGLSDDQIKMLTQIEFEWIRTLSGLKLLATAEERAAKEKADLQRRNEAADAVLTPEQKKRLTELCGKPFDVSGALALFPAARERSSR